jgi:hypothetical protein
VGKVVEEAAHQAELVSTSGGIQKLRMVSVAVP